MFIICTGLIGAGVCARRESWVTSLFSLVLVTIIFFCLLGTFITIAARPKAGA